jgi:hypothetical protein
MKEFLKFIVGCVLVACALVAFNFALDSATTYDPAQATTPPPRRAVPASRPSLRDLLRKCAAGNQRACAKLDKLIK